MDALTRLLIVSAMEKGADGVYDLMKKCYNDGYNKGRQEAIDHIFTFHPQE